MIGRNQPSPYGDLALHFTTTTPEEARHLALDQESGDRPRFGQDESITDLCIEVIEVIEDDKVQGA